ncbi:glycosyltransferase family 2 protein [Xylanimonas allomyrinae]|uniref:Glycosyltransferase family 2 protein n=1 Tax=Xylanimonas allomyrinae TaxID=2509459 RepID=A0A4P6EL63_9MICO|nr:glycosyltransferase family 2 protein [Xylanimonas allomyrinae]QAY63374.1 glycosyltransferase family 2 protein [Xylanimonas allomyrinae]
MRSEGSGTPRPTEAESPAEPPSGPRNPDVWVVIPLYNEATVVGSVIEDVLGTFSNVVCIDDGSSDDSAAVAEAAGAVVVRHPMNLGQGAALQTGFVWARRRGARYVVTFDSDGQHQVSDARDMVAVARREDVSIVFGSRFLDDRTDPGFLKKIVLGLAVLFTRWTTGLKLTDAHNGLRVIRDDALQLVDIKQDRMAHASEIVNQLADTKLAWREHPVHVLYTDYSRAKGQSLWNSVNILIDLIVN